MQAVLPVGDVSQGTLDAWLKRLNDGYRHVRSYRVPPMMQPRRFDPLHAARRTDTAGTILPIGSHRVTVS